MGHRPKDGGLSFREKRFVQAFIASRGDSKYAAKYAYNPSSDKSAQDAAYIVKKRPVVAKAIEAELAKENITKEWVLKNMVDIVVNSHDDAIRTRNLELIGKWLKMFTEIRENINYDDTLPTTALGRREEVIRLLGRLKEIGELTGGGQSLLLDQGNLGVQGTGESSPPGDLSLHREVGQKEQETSPAAQGQL